MTKRRIKALGAVSRGLATISLTGGNRTQAAVAAARRDSATRAERSWRSVGESLRDQMAMTPTNAPSTPR